MADVPTTRITGRCSPQRVDETYDDYFDRFKAHRDAWRQQFLDEYYKPKEARLPSPNSEEGLDEEELAQAVALVESNIRVENGLAEPRDLPNPRVWPPIVCVPGKTPSEISDYDPDPDNIYWRGRPEDLEYESQGSYTGSPIPEPTSMRKRSKSPAEDDALEPPAKRPRSLFPTSGVPPAGTSTSGHKRKRVQFDEPEAAREQARAGPKKRKTDAHSRPSPATATSSSKRKRASDADEACDSEVQASPSGRQASGPKRRRVGEERVTSKAAVGRDGNHTPRVTRARRRQLSGEDAQLFQLGERGQLDLQAQANETQGQVTEAATRRPRRQRSSATTTKAKPKASNTSIRANMRAAAGTSSNETKASAKVTAGGNTSAVTSAGTKSRRGRPRRQVLTNSG